MGDSEGEAERVRAPAEDRVVEVVRGVQRVSKVAFAVWGEAEDVYAPAHLVQQEGGEEAALELGRPAEASGAEALLLAAPQVRMHAVRPAHEYRADQQELHVTGPACSSILFSRRSFSNGATCDCPVRSLSRASSPSRPRRAPAPPRPGPRRLASSITPPPPPGRGSARGGGGAGAPQLEACRVGWPPPPL